LRISVIIERWLFTKRGQTLLKYPSIALAIVVVLIVRLIRPLVHIRFGVLPSIRIGHFVSEPELYLCMRDEGLLPQKTVDLFWFTGKISNQQLASMWKRTLHMHPFYHRLYLVNRQLFKFSDHGIARLPAQARDIHGFLRRTAPHLHFTPEEDARGRAAMQQLGLPPDANEAKFICYHSRDNGYSALEVTPEQIRMYGCRNSKIETYLPAAEMLAEKGYYALRLGVSTAQTFTPAHPNIIDYTMKGRSDFMDLYLLARCEFYLGDTCGLAEVPKVFRRPVAWVNFPTLEYAPTWSEQDIFIPQKCWLRAENRFLTFREMLEQGVSRYEHCTDFDDAGIDLIPNSAEEVLALAQEMDARLNGTWATTEEDEADEEDEELQQKFWSLWKTSDVNSEFKCRIGAQFLRENQDLLA